MFIASTFTPNFLRMGRVLAMVLALTATFTGCAKIITVTTSEPIQISTNKRTLGTKINDQQLETIARVNLNKASKQLEDAHINIDSFNGLVLLTGQVPNDQLRNLAGDTVGKINSVRQVHNELTAGAPTTFQERSKDSWITTKIKTKLITSSIQSRRILILTEAQTVFLMGLVSRYEADRITKVAQNTSGVKQVVKVFEYVD
ncbi:MAG: BON domain-containing protein [Cellvibrio sp.]|uniref:BON domain-containing protein n=1 Tax=Cellvibrio sp. TaxID=1965322 RepID=UPI00271FF2CF|nr:BON domain-containing protein [Cellvibrio sp.]